MIEDYDNKIKYVNILGTKVDGPVWDGNEQPRLLSTTTTEGNFSSTSSSKKPLKEIDSFSWMDDGKTVKIYIDYDNADEIADDSISLVSYLLSYSILMS